MKDVQDAEPRELNSKYHNLQLVRWGACKVGLALKQDGRYSRWSDLRLLIDSRSALRGTISDPRDFGSDLRLLIDSRSAHRFGVQHGQLLR